MNIGDASKLIKKDFPSISISRIRFLEKEGLIKPRRSKGGTRSFTEKDIMKIKKILDLQENQYYTLKAIKNNPKLLLGKSEKSKIVIDKYSKHDALKKSGLINFANGLKISINNFLFHKTKTGIFQGSYSIVIYDLF